MNKKVTGIVAYIAFIGWIIAFCAGDREGAKFHLNQSLVLWIGYFVAGILAVVLGFLGTIGTLVAGLINLFLFVCWIIGLVSAIQDKEKEIPLLGKIKILK